MLEQNETNVRGRRTDPIGRWALLAGGVSFFAGGSLHASDDPPGLSVKELVRISYEDVAWYPSHALLFVGMGLIAIALVALARGKTFASAPRVRTVAIVTATAAALAALATLLQTFAASEAGAGIALWAIAAATGLLLRARANATADTRVAYATSDPRRAP